MATIHPEPHPAEPGPAVHHAILLLCLGVALAPLGDALAAPVSAPADLTSLARAAATLLFGAVSLAATTTGQRAVSWEPAAADTVLSLAKGIALVILAAMSGPAAGGAPWGLAAAAYALAVVAHLGHIRATAVVVVPGYGAHLRAGQRSALALAVLLGAGHLGLPPATGRGAPLVAVGLATAALAAEARMARRVRRARPAPRPARA
jgi:hypothetical protein